MYRKLKIAAFVFALVVVGLFRETFFVNLNTLLYYKRANEAYPDWQISAAYRWLDVFSYQTLYISKWFITIGFMLAFWFIQEKFIDLLFHEKKATVWLSMLYLSLLLLAGLAFAGGWLFGHLNEGYRFSRIFMGLLQSPAPCMLLIPLTYFYKHNGNKI